MGCNFCSFSEQDLGVHIDMCPIVSAGPPQRGAQPKPGGAAPAGQPGPSLDGTCQHAPQGHVHLTVFAPPIVLLYPYCIFKL